MSFGRGVINSKSSKQNLNTKASTETEVVGVSDYLPNNIWTNFFWKLRVMSWRPTPSEAFKEDWRRRQRDDFFKSLIFQFSSNRRGFVAPDIFQVGRDDYVQAIMQAIR